MPARLLTSAHLKDRIRARRPRLDPRGPRRAPWTISGPASRSQVTGGERHPVDTETTIDGFRSVAIAPATGQRGGRRSTSRVRTACSSWIPASHATTRSATYRIRTADGVVRRSVDQRRNRGRWLSLGVHELTTQAVVRLSDLTGERRSSGRRVVFDAVRFVPLHESRERMGQLRPPVPRHRHGRNQEPDPSSGTEPGGTSETEGDDPPTAEATPSPVPESTAGPDAEPRSDPEPTPAGSPEPPVEPEPEKTTEPGGNSQREPERDSPRQTAGASPRPDGDPGEPPVDVGPADPDGGAHPSAEPVPDP